MTIYPIGNGAEKKECCGIGLRTRLFISYDASKKASNRSNRELIGRLLQASWKSLKSPSSFLNVR